ncbi:MAG TPA: glycosyltransferase [Nocardioides sp.]|nr:glycosyltransferase [Nocardioides sp.]
MESSDIARLTRESPADRRVATRQQYSPVIIVITALAAAGVVIYAHFLLRPGTRGDLLPWLLVIAAEGVLVVHALLAMWTMLSATKDPRSYQYWATKERLYDPSDPERRLILDGQEVGVEVFVTVYGEPVPVVRRTVEAALAIRGRHRTWLLDDGSSEAMRALAQELGCFYLRRLSSSGAKAGNLNHALTQAKGGFFCVFDADFVPSPEFIEDVLPFFTDDTVAFVQTPQTYGNLHTMIARGAGYMQTVFYRFVQPGRNHFNAAFCVGTNVMFRRTAVQEIGGIYADSKSEDVWTSLKLHERGWRSTYLARTLAIGDAPDSIEAYTKQQLRWATGGFEILLRSNPFSRHRHLTLDQRIMYGITATHYLTGIAPGLLLLVPPMEIYLDLHPVDLSVSVWQWFAVYAGFYLLQILLAFATLGSFRWEVLMLAAVSFPIYVRAFFNALFHREQKWHVTGSTRGAASPFNFIIPQVLAFVFLLVTSLVAVWQIWRQDVVTLGAAWNITNTLILGTFMAVAWREARLGRRSVRRSRATRPVAVEATSGPLSPVTVPAVTAREAQS